MLEVPFKPQLLRRRNEEAEWKSESCLRDPLVCQVGT